MPHRTFFTFMAPTLIAMLLFIAVPIVSVFIQSLHVEHEQVMLEVESCGPFGCTKEMRIDSEAMRELNQRAPMGRFNGLRTFTDSSHLAFAAIGRLWAGTDSWRGFWSGLYNLPFYKALAFTLAYTFVVTPLSIVLGFFVALGVNSLPKPTRGPAIFLSLLPMIVTPLVGSLVLFWMIDSSGVIGATLQLIFNDPQAVA